jgi:Raf kinase inhibitor-like YbhB/YbcL family protein
VKILPALMGVIAIMVSTQVLAASFQLTSPDIAEGKAIAERHIYSGFGCNGGNGSPTLAWSGAPAGTKSFAITAYDPDAPTGSGWWHWVVFNLPAATTGLAADTGNPAKNLLPAGSIQSRTDFGQPGYGGPCPPPGKPHRYIFTVHALDTETLPLDNQVSAAMVGFMVNAHALGHASLTALYGR